MRNRMRSNSEWPQNQMPRARAAHAIRSELAIEHNLGQEQHWRRLAIEDGEQVVDRPEFPWPAWLNRAEDLSDGPA